MEWGWEIGGEQSQEKARERGVGREAPGGAREEEGRGEGWKGEEGGRVGRYR